MTNIKGYYGKGLKVQLAVFTPPLFDIVKPLPHSNGSTKGLNSFGPFMLKNKALIPMQISGYMSERF